LSSIFGCQSIDIIGLIYEEIEDGYKKAE